MMKDDAYVLCCAVASLPVLFGRSRSSNLPPSTARSKGQDNSEGKTQQQEQGKYSCGYSMASLVASSRPMGPGRT